MIAAQECGGGPGGQTSGDDSGVGGTCFECADFAHADFYCTSFERTGFELAGNPGFVVGASCSQSYGRAVF